MNASAIASVGRVDRPLQIREMVQDEIRHKSDTVCATQNPFRYYAASMRDSPSDEDSSLTFPFSNVSTRQTPRKTNASGLPSSPTGGAVPTRREILPSLLELRTLGDASPEVLLVSTKLYGNCGAELRFRRSFASMANHRIELGPKRM
jgi:hypothetical protein